MYIFTFQTFTYIYMYVIVVVIVGFMWAAGYPEFPWEENKVSSIRFDSILYICNALTVVIVDQTHLDLVSKESEMCL